MTIEALLTACEAGNTTEIQELLVTFGHQIDLNEESAEGMTPLLQCIVSGHPDAVTLLLQAPGIDVNLGKPLVHACRLGHVAVVSILLGDPRIDPLVVNDGGNSPLHEAAGNGHDDVMVVMLQDQRIDVNAVDAMVGSALHHACMDGFEEGVRLLLDDPRTEVNLRGPFDFTPLMVAAVGDHEGVVKMLLADSRVNPDAPTVGDVATLITCCQNGQANMVRLLLDHPRVDINNHANSLNYTPLKGAACSGRLFVTQMLLAESKLVDTTVVSNPGAFHWQGMAASEAARSHLTAPTTIKSPKPEDCVAIAELIDAYQTDPEGTRFTLWTLPGIRERMISAVYALVVFFSDGLLVLKPGAEFTPLGRFLLMTRSLPQELQSVMCCRLFGSPQDSIPSAHSEKAFASLARALLL